MSTHSPMDLPYMRLIRWSLSYVASWPCAPGGEGGGGGGSRKLLRLTRNHRFLFCVWVVSTVCQILYVRENLNKLSFVDMGHNYITVLISFVVTQRITMPEMKSYREVVELFVSEMHLLHHEHKSAYARKVYKKVNSICKFFCYLNHAQLFGVIGLFIAMPIINNFRAGMYSYSANRPQNVTYEHTLYYKMPFDCHTNFKGYMAAFTLNTWIVIDVAIIIGVPDLFLSLIVFHTWGHLKILDHNLRNFPRPEMRPREGSSSDLGNPPWYSQEESQQIAQMLKDNINHHRLVLNLVNKTSSTYGIMLAVYLAFHQVSGCILLLECSELDPVALSKYLPMTVAFIQQLMQLSIIFELIGTKSETLMDAVYSVPWECMRVSERRSVLVFLCNVQSTPISIHAMGLVPIGVQTMASILKTSFSYFLMLRTIAVSK